MRSLLMDSPQKIKEQVDNNFYQREKYDVESRIRYSMVHKENHTELEYHICSKLENELKKAGYHVSKTDNWFFGKRTIITWG